MANCVSEARDRKRYAHSWLLEQARRILCAGLVVSCREVQAQRAGPDAAPLATNGAELDGTVTTGDAGRAALPPLGGAAWLEPIELDDGELAYVTPPLGAEDPRPIIVGVHGLGDRGDWACGGWRLASSNYAFVVCPQGKSLGGGLHAWESPEAVRRRIELAVSAVRKRFGAYVAEGPMIYAGFSQGANRAEATLLNEAHLFPVAILVEGAYRILQSPSFARKFRAGGGQRIVIACGGGPCFDSAKAEKVQLERAGLEVIVTGDTHAGHSLNKQMQNALQRVWPDVVRGLPGWTGWSPSE